MTEKTEKPKPSAAPSEHNDLLLVATNLLRLYDTECRNLRVCIVAGLPSTLTRERHAAWSDLRRIIENSLGAMKHRDALGESVDAIRKHVEENSDGSGYYDCQTCIENQKTLIAEVERLRKLIFESRCDARR